MKDLLTEVLVAIESRHTIQPPNLPVVELIAGHKMGLDDEPSIRHLQKRILDELDIRLLVVGGGIGCTRIVVTADCVDVDEARRLLNELFFSRSFANVAVEVGFRDLLRYQPYAHKTLASGRVLGVLPDDAIPVFVSYARADDLFRLEMEKHLSGLIRQKELRMWNDRRISAGAEWAKEIEEALESARMIVLLVSADFFASEYCAGIEMSYAMRRHHEGRARVIPIVVRPSDWEDSPLASLQVLPTNGKPVSVWSNQDEAWTNVAKSIRAVVRELRQR